MGQGASGDGPIDRRRTGLSYRMWFPRGDTDLTPYVLGGFGSRTTYVCGNAALDAAKRFEEGVFEVAAEILEAKPED